VGHLIISSSPVKVRRMSVFASRHTRTEVYAYSGWYVGGGAALHDSVKGCIVT